MTDEMRTIPASKVDVTDEDWMSDDYYVAKLALFRSAVGPEVARADVEVTGGCGNGTCEFTEVEILLTMNDGTRRWGRTSFGGYVSEIVRDGDVNELTRIEWFEVVEEDNDET